MPGFSSIDDMISEISSGKVLTIPWNKITGAAAYTVGRWYDTFTLTGQPPAGAYAGTALTKYTLTDTTTGAIYHGGNKSADLKYLLAMEALVSAATGIPCYLLLVDLLAYYPSIDMNTGSAQTMLSSTAGTNILPTRQGAQHSGANVQMFLEAASTTGSTAHDIAISYTNSALAYPHALGATVSGVVSTITPTILHSGVAVNNFGPFLPLAAGDAGVASVQTLTLSAATSSASTAHLVLCEPIAKLPLGTVSVASARDFLFNIPSLPQIKDGACLAFLLYTGSAAAAYTNYFALLDVAWG